MNDNRSFSHETSSQFALSYELLHLLQWLGKYEVEKLKKIIAKAVAQGLHNDIQKTHSITDANILQDMHHNMIDFFELLDDLLCDAINNHVQQKAREKGLFPSIDLIDSTICDNETVRSSVEKTTHVLDTQPNINGKELLFKELLKKWRPVSKHHMN